MQGSHPAQVSPSHLAQAQGGPAVPPPEPGSTVEARATPATSDTYDAFISYRRAQGRRVATWLSHKLERYRPGEILKQLPPALCERLQKRHRVFLDTRYERSNK